MVSEISRERRPVALSALWRPRYARAVDEEMESAKLHRASRRHLDDCGRMSSAMAVSLERASWWSSASISAIIIAFLFAGSLFSVRLNHAQNARPDQRPSQPPTLGLEQGYIELDTPDFTLKLVKASQTVAALQPKGANGFDFTPADRLER